LNNKNNNFENEIVSLLHQRDMRGVHLLYDQYGEYIFGFINKIIYSEQEAELVLQDTFLKVWDKIGSFSEKKGRFITWVINIARNTAIDMSRSKNYKHTLKLTSLDHIPQNKNFVNIDVKMENIDVRDIVLKLDLKYSEILELLYFEEYTHKEVAEKLNIPLGTVKGRVRKAFKDIRIIFES